MPAASKRSTRFWILAALPALIVTFGIVLRRSAETRPLPGSSVVLLLLVPGTTLADWQNSANTPAMQTLAKESLIGVFPTRASGLDSDPLRDSCRTFGAGDRSVVLDPGELTLGEALKRNEVSVTVIADDGDAARLFVQEPSDPLRVTPDWRTQAPAFPDNKVTAPDPFAAAMAAAVQCSSGNSGKRLIVADFDDLYRLDRYSALALPQALEIRKCDAVQRLDRVIGDLIFAKGVIFRDGRTDVCLLVASPTVPMDAVASGERLGPLFLWSPLYRQFGTPLLTSPATRNTPGLIAGTDLASTIADLLNMPDDSRRIGVGRSATLSGKTVDDPGRFIESRVAAWSSQARRQRALIYAPWCLSALLALATILSLRSHDKICRVSIAIAVSLTLYPLALVLVSSLLPAGVKSAALYAFSALPSVLLFIGLWTMSTARRNARSILVGIAGLTLLMYLIDVALGGPLNSRSPLAYSVAEAARYYGIGNEAAGLIIGSALIATLSLGGKSLPSLLAGLAVAAALGHPALGAKAGGLIGTLAGFGTLVVFDRGVTSRRNNRRKVFLTAAVLAAIVVAVVLVYSIWDSERPVAVRSHVGEAIAMARAQGPAVLAAIARRKAAMNLHLLVSSPWAILLASEILLSAILWRRRRDRLLDTERNVLRAVSVAALTLFLLDDSGVVAAATCLLWIAPLLLTANENGGGFAMESAPDND